MPIQTPRATLVTAGNRLAHVAVLTALTVGSVTSTIAQSNSSTPTLPDSVSLRTNIAADGGGFDITLQNRGRLSIEAWSLQIEMTYLNGEKQKATMSADYYRCEVVSNCDPDDSPIVPGQTRTIKLIGARPMPQTITPTMRAILRADGTIDGVSAAFDGVFAQRQANANAFTHWLNALGPLRGTEHSAAKVAIRKLIDEQRLHPQDLEAKGLVLDIVNALETTLARDGDAFDQSCEALIERWRREKEAALRHR